MRSGKRHLALTVPTLNCLPTGKFEDQRQSLPIQWGGDYRSTRNMYSFRVKFTFRGPSGLVPAPEGCLTSDISDGLVSLAAVSVHSEGPSTVMSWIKIAPPWAPMKLYPLRIIFKWFVGPVDRYLGWRKRITCRRNICCYWNTIPNINIYTIYQRKFLFSVISCTDLQNSSGGQCQ